MSTDTVLADLRDGVLSITLNRPEKLNAFNEEMHRAFRVQLDRAQSDRQIRSLLLTGAGRGFCVGQDLTDRDPRKRGGPPDLGRTLEVFYNPSIRLMRSLDKPIICAVNGVAAGAGVGLALACDIVLAAKSARFLQVFSKVGLVPDAGGSWMMPRYIGEARAKALLLTGEPLPAQTAADWGLIWKAVPDDDLNTEARGLAEQLAAGPTYSLGLTKRLVQQAAGNDLETHLDNERDCQRDAGQTADYAEGVLAFLEKRSPSFGGR